MTTIYIAGPISGAAIEERRAVFNSAALALKTNGHTPLNPMDIPPECDESCTGSLERPDDHHARACYLKWDLIVMLRDAKAVALLPGWRSSIGASMEKAVAEHCGLRVRTIEEWLAPVGRS
jgi:hypothetical protein